MLKAWRRVSKQPALRAGSVRVLEASMLLSVRYPSNQYLVTEERSPELHALAGNTGTARATFNQETQSESPLQNSTLQCAASIHRYFGCRGFGLHLSHLFV
ncbi:hypothetical protein NDU88_006836 [Pleurodeles waltl]|uniref:Uncharacterized protein n=1 Tax=Pleurodeles waltl TaxID=8319 RepID=A0AAV7SQM0_PLEWA|nr:hypothetical protein NDU88_006836 [Pleurodeles waltl]